MVKKMYKKIRIEILSTAFIFLIIFFSILPNTFGKQNEIEIISKENSLKNFLDNSYSQLHCFLPSQAIIGMPINITVQAWDWAERICKKPFDSKINFTSTDKQAELPDDFSFSILDKGIKTLEGVIFKNPGTHYIIVTDIKKDIFAVSNPIKVTEDEPEYKWYWGDIHCHSKISDGSGSLENSYKYARDVSILDFCAYTDHDVCFESRGYIWQTQKMKLFGWEKTKKIVSDFYTPDRFVTILAYEYSNDFEIYNTHGDGHYCVYYNTVEDAPFYSSIDEKSNRIFELWNLLKIWKNQSGNDVFTVPHHLLDKKLGWDSNYYDSEMVPLIEIYQQRGSSEMSNSHANPIPFRYPEIEEPGHSVQDGLAKGYKFGFIAGSDDHSGHPGHHLPFIAMQSFLTEPNCYKGLFGVLQKLISLNSIISMKEYEAKYEQGGLVGVYAKELTRDEIFNGLKDRRCVAVTRVDRILIDFSVNGYAIGNGSEISVSNRDSPRVINCSIAGTAPISNVTLVKNNESLLCIAQNSTDPQNLTNYKINFTYIDAEPITGVSWDCNHNTNVQDYYYIRVIQTNGEAAWIGPIWVNSLSVINQ